MGSLHHPLESIPFPFVDDFEVILDDSYKPSGYHIQFVSKKRGYLAGFPWWNHVELDLYREGFAIPLDFEDFEQSWKSQFWRMESERVFSLAPPLHPLLY